MCEIHGTRAFGHHKTRRQAIIKTYYSWFIRKTYGTKLHLLYTKGNNDVNRRQQSMMEEEWA